MKSKNALALAPSRLSHTAGNFLPNEARSETFTTMSCLGRPASLYLPSDVEPPWRVYKPVAVLVK